MSRPRYRRSGNPGEPDAGRTQDHDKSAAPVVKPVAPVAKSAAPAARRAGPAAR